MQTLAQLYAVLLSFVGDPAVCEGVWGMLQHASGSLNTNNSELAGRLAGEADLAYQADADGEGSGSNPTGLRLPSPPVMLLKHLHPACLSIACEAAAFGIEVQWLTQAMATVATTVMVGQAVRRGVAARGLTWAARGPTLAAAMTLTRTAMAPARILRSTWALLIPGTAPAQAQAYQAVCACLGFRGFAGGCLKIALACQYSV
jgi:hypothetical protein